MRLHPFYLQRPRGIGFMRLKINLTAIFLFAFSYLYSKNINNIDNKKKYFSSTIYPAIREIHFSACISQQTPCTRRAHRVLIAYGMALCKSKIKESHIIIHDIVTFLEWKKKERERSKDPSFFDRTTTRGGDLPLSYSRTPTHNESS